jgi:drug/metabolite transporter (DMT)-like permease
VLAQYLVLALTWGSSFLLIKVGLEGLSPGQVVLARTVLGTAALAAVVAVTRQRLPREPVVWAHLAVVGVLLCTVPFSLYAWAELRVASGLASILNATTPLMTMAVSLLALRTERLGWGRALGLLLGFTGVVIVFAPWTTGLGMDGDLTAKLACLLATLCYGIAFVWLRRFVAPRGLPAAPVALVQVGLGTTVIVALSPWLASTPVQLTPRVVAAMLGLGVFGTGLAYLWNTNVVSAWGAVRASTVTYLAPLVGVVAGAAFLGEAITVENVLGGAVIVGGVIVGHRAAARDNAADSTPNSVEKAPR